MVKRQGNAWVVTTEAGRVLGRYASKAAAEAQAWPSAAVDPPTEVEGALQKEEAVMKKMSKKMTPKMLQKKAKKMMKEHGCDDAGAPAPKPAKRRKRS